MLRIIKYCLLVLLLAGLWGLLALSWHGLPEALTRSLARRLQVPGLVLSVDKIQLGVCEGIIVSGLRCHRPGDIGAPLFEAARVVLPCDPSGWFKGQAGLNAARIEQGWLRLMLAGQDDLPPRLLPLEILQAQLVWEPAPLPRIRVLDMLARLPGCELAARGVFNLAPIVDRPPAWPAELRSWVGAELYEQLELRQAAHIDCTFQATGADLSQLGLYLKIRARDTHLAEMSAAAWRAQISLRNAQAQGCLEIKKGRWPGLELREAHGRFSADAHGLTIAELAALLGAPGLGCGPLSLQLHYAWPSTEFTGQWQAQVDPRVLTTLLQEKYPVAARDLNDFQFAESKPPRTAGQFKGRWQPAWELDLTGQAAAQEVVYRGVASSAARAAVTVSGTKNNLLVALRPLSVVRPEGSGQGSLYFDFAERQISFEGWSELDPYALAPMINPFMDRLVRQFQFAGPVQTRAWGRLGWGWSAADAMELVLVAQQLGWRMLLADSCALDMHLRGDHLEIDAIQGNIYGGSFSARASLDTSAAAASYELEAAVHGAGFDRLLQAFTGAPAGNYAGSIDAQLTLAGISGEGQGASARGSGWVKVSNGHVFQIPLLGGLSDFLTRIIPGLNLLLRQTDARAAFCIENGRIHADEILIEGDVFSLLGRGDYYLDGTLDFTVQVKLLRQHTFAADVFRVVIYPVSRMLEFHLGGTLEAPCWRPVNIPKALFFMFD